MRSPARFLRDVERIRQLFEQEPQLEATLPALCTKSGVPRAHCPAALAALVNQGFLRVEKDAYARADRPGAGVRRRTA